MRRSVLARLIAVLLPLWLAFLSGAPVLLHACPEHGGAAHATVAHHGGGTPSSSDSDADKPAGHGRCTCLGPCCAVEAVALVAAALRVPTLPDASLDVATYRTRVAIPRRVRAHLLPPALGPPATPLI